MDTDPNLYDDQEQEPYEPVTVGELESVSSDDDSAPAAESTAAPSREPLFSELFRQAINPDDPVLRDYADYVIPHLSAQLAHVTAKGGTFARQKRAEGVSAEEVARYGDDQSLRAHLVNGLLPAAQIARTLKQWDFHRFTRWFDETTYRLFCAGYTLHDWVKLPDAKAALDAAGLSYRSSVVPHLPTVETIFRDCCIELGLDRFLEPLGPLDDLLHDLILIAQNTQVRSGTLNNLSALSRLHASGRQRQLATDLSRLADYITYLGRTPVDLVSNPNMRAMLESFNDDDQRAVLTYHHLADVRGVVTNIINNAALDACRIDGRREPLLYAPTGVVYLSRSDAPPLPSVADVADAALVRVRELCRQRLAQHLIGFGRSGKGIKYADYYNLFFSPRQLAPLVARFANTRILKNPTAGKRYDSIAAKNLAPGPVDLELPRDHLEIERLAETCALLVRIAADSAPDFDAEGWLLERLGVADQRHTVHAINSHRTAGGVPYGWYYAAGLHRRQTTGLDDTEWIAHLDTLAQDFAAHLPDDPPMDAPGWQELRQYITDHLHFQEQHTGDLADRLRTEVQRYGTARKSGRGATNVCSLCSSSYQVDVQQEAAILFAPMVYTNKQPLHGSKAIRHICAICGMEMMLRQLLMKRGRESGKNFEGRRLRYLFCYPTYFFTPETLKMLRLLHDRLRRVSFTALRRALLPESAATLQQFNLNIATFQHLAPFLCTPAAITSDDDDRLFRLRYEEREVITFGFIGIPPARSDAKDAEAWVHPAFLALVLPLLLDVKVVAGEGMLPLFNEANELPETVAFDGAHTFIRYLCGVSFADETGEAQHTNATRLTLDDLGPALHRLTAAYLIHLDGNARGGAGGYDYRWNDLPALARDLATSPLYAFHYLKKGLRSGDSDTIGGAKAALYLDLFTYLAPGGDPAMTHAQELTRRYRQFYRVNSFRSNAILRPLSVAAKAMLDADPYAYAEAPALIELIHGELHKMLQRIESNQIDGYFPKGSTRESRDEAIAAFSAYLVNDVYVKAYGEDRSAFRGRQLNLLKNACEVIYLAEQRREKQERAAQGEPVDEPPDEASDESEIDAAMP
ncbi:MAG: type I-D CRISPR-associated protein Cas10d/Csc3 [Chloroflexaceae bacterium]